jgi:general secretion pathway protein C
MTARLMSLLIWAAVAASGVYWGLRLFTQPTPVPVGATVAAAAAPAVGDLSRLLGEPPAQPVPGDAQAPVADSRFRLVGVVAPRGGAATGLALISVDGKPARAVAVGRELEPGLRLLTVSHRQAELGAVRGAPAMTLALPPLAEAQRGRPGEAVLPTAGLPGALPGTGPPMLNRPLGGLPAGAMGLLQPGGPRLLGGAQGQPLPGMPIQPPAESQESTDTAPTDSNGLATR